VWLRCPACEARLELPEADLPVERVVVSCRCGAAAKLVAQVARSPEEAQEKRLLARIEQQLHEGTISLPTLPKAAAEILRQTRDAKATFQDVARAIERDPGISVRLLQLANSTMYRGRIETRTVQQAVSRLGLRSVRSLVIGFLSTSVYRTSERRFRRLVERLWRHAVQVGVAARAVARAVSMVGAAAGDLAASDGAADGAAEIDPDLAFTGGLLHDVGKVVLLQILVKTSPALARTMSEPRIDKVTGRFHDVVGGRLLSAWELDADLCAVARDHHRVSPSPAGTSRERLVATVALADALCHARAAGRGAVDLETLGATAAAVALGIGVDALRGVSEDAEHAVAETASILT